MRIGVVIPTFREQPDEALAMAAEASRLGIDGVFAYDHLYPMGSPDRPALAPFPILARVAVEHPQLFVGTLVARVGLVATDVLAAEFAALDVLSPGHAICAAGTGDRLSAEENVAWGIPVGSAGDRRRALEDLASTLLSAGRQVWIGGGAAPTLEMAERIGATVNLWGASPTSISAPSSRASGGPVRPGRCSAVPSTSAGWRWSPGPEPPTTTLWRWSSAASTTFPPMSSPPSTA